MAPDAWQPSHASNALLARMSAWVWPPLQSTFADPPAPNMPDTEPHRLPGTAPQTLPAAVPNTAPPTVTMWVIAGTPSWQPEQLAALGEITLLNNGSFRLSTVFIVVLVWTLVPSAPASCRCELFTGQELQSASMPGYCTSRE